MILLAFSRKLFSGNGRFPAWILFFRSLPRVIFQAGTGAVWVLVTVPFPMGTRSRRLVQSRESLYPLLWKTAFPRVPVFLVICMVVYPAL